MAGVRTFRPHMGSRQVRSSYGASSNALTADFRASMAEVLGNYDRFVDHIEGATPAIIRDAVEPTLRKAEVYCPADTGDLRKSKFLEVETRRGQHVVAIGFGKGGKPDYAVFVHEMPYAHVAPTRSKFLQAALEEDQGSFAGRIARGMKLAAGT